MRKFLRPEMMRKQESRETSKYAGASICLKPWALMDNWYRERETKPECWKGNFIIV
jgi:hypothetical protein